MSSMESTTVMKETERKENAMTNKSKKKGTTAETKVVNYLRDQGFNAERIALHGSSDQGDIIVRLNDKANFILEIKTGKQTENYSRAKKSEWLKQAKEEAINYGLAHDCVAFAYLVIVKYNKPFVDAEVWKRLSSAPDELWYLDEFHETIESWIDYYKEKKGGE